MTGSYSKAEVLPGPERRRSWSTAEKLSIVQETYEADVTVSLVARRHGVAPNQLFALNWLASRPTVSNIVIGARNEEQLRQNLGAIGWSLSSGQVARLDKASHKEPAYPYWH